MKVLLIVTDLYRVVGGGQTVYRKIVEATHDVQFFYFRRDETLDAPRPGNAAAIPLLERRGLTALCAPPFPEYRRRAVEEADQFARSVAGQSFEVVDLPDFCTFGAFLRDAFAHHRVHVDRVVLAMHGNISESMEMQWGSPGEDALEQRALEQEQFAAVDAAYALSPRYQRQWQAKVDRPVHSVDPIHFVDIDPDRALGWDRPAGEKPGLYCIGRMERRKGNDLFVKIVRWLSPDLYASATHVGDLVYTSQGTASSHLLSTIAAARDLTIGFHRSMRLPELWKVFRQQSLVVLPVRYDTLNLVALEALFNGCPVAISSEAGVCDYLDARHPELPYVKIDFDNFYDCVPRISDLLSNYSTHRARLAQALAKHFPGTVPPLNMSQLYERICRDPSTAAGAGRDPIRYRDRTATETRSAVVEFRVKLPRIGLRTVGPAARFATGVFRQRLMAWTRFGPPELLRLLGGARRVPSYLRYVAQMPERNRGELRDKLDRIYELGGHPVFRCNLWLDIARMERILGNDLLAATYELRVLRLMGKDSLGLLPRVQATLTENRFISEAQAARAMYADPASAETLVHELLCRQRDRLGTYQDRPYEVVDDRRAGSARVAVIVSLYKAASKLRVFLTCLAQQTSLRRGQVEIVLVDSGSPDCEYAEVQSFVASRPLNFVYARSRERETIQAAWNRGIALSRAPYLVFLGVDETLYPEALETLAAALDADGSVDWVMANSLVTSVDARGVYEKDVMPYRRDGATKDFVYLETCYLSWVGGMYRRSIHDRFGYYDESFGAAGDTEFKNRILPAISVKFIPRTLGVFLNYPDERTTASPRAEIEDLRAWYLHRTPGGVRYAFEHRDPRDAVRLLCAAVGYRKSYCGHISSDIDYAAYLAAYLAARDGHDIPDWAKEISKDLMSLQRAVQALEFVDHPPASSEAVALLAQAWKHMQRSEVEHKRVLATHGAAPRYVFSNDNRYEQHSWLWKS